MNKIAIIFPGQGSQQIGMLKELYKNYSIIKNTFEQASKILNYDLWKLIQDGPLEKLNQTQYTQPAILTASVAIWKIWMHKQGTLPKFMAGHSLGEYSALVCADSMNFSDAIKLVELRGILMQQAVPEEKGAMSAIIGINKKIITQLCENVSQNEIVSIASLNTDNQTIIAGHKEAVIRANIACKKAGAKYTKLLPISVPSHCSLMKPIAKKLSLALEEIIIYSPKIPILNNVDASLEQDPKNIKKALVRQLYNPVKWIDIIQYLSNKNIELLLEFGPGKILSHFTKNIVNSLPSISVNDIQSLNKALNY